MWIWMIRAIAGSILGNATAEWFKKTKLGVWFYNKVDSIYKWAAHKYDVKILTEEEKKMEKEKRHARLGLCKKIKYSGR